MILSGLLPVYLRCRKALALQNLGQEVEALVELEAAAKLVPDNQNIKKDVKRLREYINNISDSDSEESEDAIFVDC